MRNISKKGKKEGKGSGSHGERGKRTNKKGERLEGRVQQGRIKQKEGINDKYRRKK